MKTKKSAPTSRTSSAPTAPAAPPAAGDAGRVPASNPRKKATIAALATTVAVLAVAFGVQFAGAVPVPAVITVVFSQDDMGFNATSSKDISNVIVEFCDGSTHKHDDLSGHFFNHTETQVIVGVWVKSGNNGDPDGPPGAGERFDNEGVECGPTETTSPPTTTPPETTETTPPETTETTPPETTPPETSPPPSTEIPFFPSAGALALGTIGALGSAFVVMRRK